MGGMDRDMGWIRTDTGRMPERGKCVKVAYKSASTGEVYDDEYAYLVEYDVWRFQGENMGYVENVIAWYDTEPYEPLRVSVALTTAQCREIHDIVRMQDLIEDAKKHWAEEEKELSDGTAFSFPEPDFREMAELFERKKDCNIAENDTWHGIMSDYISGAKRAMENKDSADGLDDAYGLSLSKINDIFRRERMRYLIESAKKWYAEIFGDTPGMQEEDFVQMAELFESERSDERPDKDTWKQVIMGYAMCRD